MPLHKGNLNAQRFFTAKNANSYDKIVYAATFGQDKVWKKQIAKMVKECNFILDLGCGTGILSAMLQQNINFGIVYGLDLTFEYLKVALAKRMNMPLLNATAEALPFMLAVVAVLSPAGAAGLAWLAVAFFGVYMLARLATLGWRVRGASWMTVGA